MELFIKLRDKYGDLNTHDLWKFLATIFMLIDHFGLYIFQNEYYRIIGRLSFPIFAILYGYSFKNKLNISLLLWGSMVISINYFLNNNTFPLNILYSFFIASIFMKYYNKIAKKEFDDFLIIIFLILIHYILKNFIEYGSLAILFMLITKKEQKFKNYYFAFIFLFYFVEQSICFGFSMLQQILFGIELVIIIPLLYNYKIKEINCGSNFISNFTKSISRFSMEFYSIQLCLFKIFIYFKFYN